MWCPSRHPSRCLHYQQMPRLISRYSLFRHLKGRLPPSSSRGHLSHPRSSHPRHRSHSSPLRGHWTPMKNLLREPSNSNSLRRSTGSLSSPLRRHRRRGQALTCSRHLTRCNLRHKIAYPRAGGLRLPLMSSKPLKRSNSSPYGRNERSSSSLWITRPSLSAAAEATKISSRGAAPQPTLQG